MLGLPFDIAHLIGRIDDVARKAKAAHLPALDAAAYRRIYFEMELIHDANGVDSKVTRAAPLHEAIQFLIPGVQKAISHWREDEKTADKSQVEFFLQHLEALEKELIFFRLARDWLLEPAIKVTFTQKEALVLGTAASISYQWRQAGAGNISDGRDSPLSEIVSSLALNLGHLTATLDSVSNLLRKHKPAAGWGTRRPLAAENG